MQSNPLSELEVLLGEPLDAAVERESTAFDRAAAPFERSIVIFGAGNLGHALVAYRGFASRGFAVVGLFDTHPDVIGQVLGAPGAQVTVRSLAELESVVMSGGAHIGVIATPAEAAQDVCDRLVAAGVRSILNFAPTVLAVPADVEVREVDLAVELQILAFHEQRRLDEAAPTTPYPPSLGEAINA